MALSLVSGWLGGRGRGRTGPGRGRGPLARPGPRASVAVGPGWPPAARPARRAAVAAPAARARSRIARGRAGPILNST